MFDIYLLNSIIGIPIIFYMKVFVLIFLMHSIWAFADIIDDQVDALQAHMQKALDVQNLNNDNIKQKMKEMSDSLADADISHLNSPVNEPPDGMSEEGFRELGAVVEQTLNKHGVSEEDLGKLKKEISNLTESR